MGCWGNGSLLFSMMTGTAFPGGKFIHVSEKNGTTHLKDGDLKR